MKDARGGGHHEKSITGECSILSPLARNASHLPTESDCDDRLHHCGYAVEAWCGDLIGTKHAGHHGGSGMAADGGAVRGS